MPNSTLSNNMSAIETLLELSIDEYCSFTKKNRALMERLMKLNQTLQEERNEISGDNAAYNGNSWQVDMENKQTPSYVEDIDYYNNYASVASSSEYTHEMSSSESKNYTIHNQLYYTTKNLYPDDLNVQNSAIPQWKASNQRSLLYKTQKLFHDRKIKTLISRFSTSSNGDSIIEKPTDTTSKFGMSHGNGLLRKNAEEGSSADSYNINGYNNPYCRVWTHHYQYDMISKLIRPFNNGEEDSEDGMSLSDFHTWPYFGDDGEGNNNCTGKDESDSTDEDESKAAKYGWKTGNVGWDLSVLNKNGFVNITPKYKGGGANNLHTKQCMFSIENLAWQGYDPYQFEQALSWEQRGPLGGRIMWFPPYGIKFNETANVTWSSHTFIGRGENVYTYSNTNRSGVLSFMMVVDHPSVLDYVSWQKGSENEINDTDVLRFFSGCDSDTLRNAAKPMLLTDEYIEDTTDYNEYEEAVLAEDDDEEGDDEPSDTEKTITFYVFFPNNYSGYYDRMGDDVEAVAYLLDGNGTQKDSDKNDISLAFDDIDGTNGTGYEMGNAIGKDDSINYIIGSKITWSTAYKKNITSYQESDTKKWYYRIDGEYKIPDKADQYKNCYDQSLLIETNYYDDSNNDLNLDAESVKSAQEDDSDNLYSFAEVAAALMSESNRNSFISKKMVDEENVEELVDIFENYTLSSISGIGYSTSQGNNSDESTNTNRNYNLAYNRAETVINWICENMSLTSDNSSISVESGKNVVSQNISDIDSKKYRNAKITLSFNKTEENSVAESEQVTTDSDGNEVSASVQKYIGYTSATDSSGKTYYIKNDDSETTYWVEVEEGSNKGLLKRVELVGNTITEIDTSGSKNDTERGSYDTESGNSSGERNSLRYDKEYYFFKELETKSPLIYDRLMQKIQYFDPAYHSMTPEGFNARLTFLQQCTRQGNTIGASDSGTSVANNLAFGKPPFCVLRLGDFYNQMIVIDNINISYDESTWDLNPEGIGVQPMIANVNISFKFIGGGDLAGPIRRLQNAMTFNYYANARLYDNRADRIKYNWDDKTNGAIDHDVDTSGSYYYSAAMYNNNDND